MPRVTIVTLTTLALALAACEAPAETAADGAGEASGNDVAGAASPQTPSDAAPDTPVSNTATPEGAATATAAASRQAVDSNPPGDECGASKVAQFVSQEATPAVRARLASEVGHDRIRWVGPDTFVTMDFRPDRLNVALDANDVITGGKCS